MIDRDTRRELERRIDRYINIERHYLQDVLDLNPEMQEVAKRQRTIIHELEQLKKHLELRHNQYVQHSKINNMLNLGVDETKPESVDEIVDYLSMCT